MLKKSPFQKSITSRGRRWYSRGREGGRLWRHLHVAKISQVIFVASHEEEKCSTIIVPFQKFYCKIFFVFLYLSNLRSSCTHVCKIAADTETLNCKRRLPSLRYCCIKYEFTHCVTLSSRASPHLSTLAYNLVSIGVMSH